MVTPSQALLAIPATLRDPLLAEFRSIVQNYAEQRWSPSELSGGKYCEIVFTIVEGFATGAYAAKPKKPASMVDACRSLEKTTALPRSFQILIPRLLPALYEIRNNRGVGHAGGDVDPNHMDATAVLAIASWILAELVRVYHGLSIPEAQALVDSLVERRVPLVWQVGDMKRVLDPKLGLREQVLLLTASASGPVAFSELLAWADYDDEGYFKRLLRKMHRDRLIEFSGEGQLVHILPPGALAAQELIEAATSR